ncbi:TonB-dependent receptor [Kordiimonas marina]|uniref:TonB-dependent receptor n=1 Tax=Kordiimonas marina TaxID=2872312 RepID=UPI001FF2265B|nr:TonB-dependent receptor [Kordiimonas marina]MCJ9427956.1 TonB-dependent receptor [Kordiimonas marina]
MLSAAAVAMVSQAPAVHAQVIQEITITAQKRAESSQKVGVSVTAFTGDALKQFGFEDSTQIVAQVPGLNVGTPVGEGNNPSFTLRGVGLNDFNDNNEGPIAIYVDEAYQAALPGLTFQLFDVERVEVLRGPQGTIYGRNATGGLIKFVSKKPTDEFEGYVTAEGGAYSSVKLTGAVSGPISDRVKARLAADYNYAKGYVHNTLGPTTDGADSIALRGQIETKIGEDGSLNLTGLYSRSNTNAPQYQHQSTLGATGADNLPFCPTDVPRDIYCYADTDGNNRSGNYNRQGPLKIEVQGIHATYKQLFGEVELTNAFSYQHTQKLHKEDTDVGPFRGIAPTFRSRINAYSDELRLNGEYDKGVWQVGLFYLHTKVKGNNDLHVWWRGDYAALLDSDPAVFGGALEAFTPGFPKGAGLVPAIYYDVNYTQKTDSYAIFGQGEYQLTDDLKLTLGARYTKEKRSFDYINRAPAGYLLNNVLNGVGEANYFSMQAGAVNGFAAALGAGPADVVSPDASKIDNGNFLGKAALDWQVNDHTLMYLSWSRGFKAGGFNAGFIDQTDFLTSSQIAFKPEILDSYETGVKWTSENKRFRINASGFYYDYKDFQALTFQGLSQFITNGKAKFYGGEAEIGILPMDRLNIQLGASLLHTDVDGVTVQGATLNNRQAVLAPQFTANGFVSYDWPVEKGDLTTTASFNYQGSHYFDITNSDISKQNGYMLVDLKVAYRFEDSGVELSAYAKNIFDKEYKVYTFDFTGIAGFNQLFYGKPRWWGVSVSYDF